ncbi:hypothetical protein BJV74DRAFT_840739 [Russula compacta]|nr:hypothetical protein BJV74DRAFT_840739 [Russula compacta]
MQNATATIHGEGQSAKALGTTPSKPPNSSFPPCSQTPPHSTIRQRCLGRNVPQIRRHRTLGKDLAGGTTQYHSHEAR